MSKLDGALAEVAAKQHSLIRWADVAALKGKRSFVAYRVECGMWEWVARGVYRLAGVPWTYEARVLAAIFAAGDGAVASHRCAARLHGRLGFEHADVEVSIPRGRQHERVGGCKVHTSRDLDRADVVTVNGIPVTGVARTLLDLAGCPKEVRDPQFTKLVEKARRAKLVDWRNLAVCLAAHARKGRRGVTRLRETIAAGVERDGLTDTDAELIAYALLKEHGFDTFVMHHLLRAADGEKDADMDLADIDRRINLEIDGPIHRRDDVARKDARRDSRVRQRGWIVERIPNEIPAFEPREFLRIARQAIKDAEARDVAFR